MVRQLTSFRLAPVNGAVLPASVARDFDRSDFRALDSSANITLCRLALWVAILQRASPGYAVNVGQLLADGAGFSALSSDDRTLVRLSMLKQLSGCI